MNVKKTVTITLLFFVFALGSGLKTSAMTTGFTTESMNSEKQKLFKSNINIISLHSYVKTNPIVCFDVNNDGLIALGFDDDSHKTICVYNPDGEFIYGYSFESSGSFGVEWDGGNILIYFVRSDVAALFNSSATCLELKMISNSTENNTYWNHTVFEKKRIVGKNEYEIKNDLGILNIVLPSYSQLIKTDENGIKTMLYNVNDSYGAKILVILVGIIIFIIIVVVGIIKEFKKKNIVK
ncbi:hypothetical protein [[Clostridium] fimetarium]|uniref:Uncharacterized protein n=1 Tax=[Clostridium] fimetarium TaxID=99656 RepID=A0A1I0QYR5_9FIRM|nr:hypothetical protein [[Clostridium] fimetarium]SEW32783.1 hypothetical protein SAMN05421659_11022 [[Clostridium] fimetarium]